MCDQINIFHKKKEAKISRHILGFDLVAFSSILIFTLVDSNWQLFNDWIVRQRRYHWTVQLTRKLVGWLRNVVGIEAGMNVISICWRFLNH